jgi:tetratricopeptide (TPR) repeat protein
MKHFTALLLTIILLFCVAPAWAGKAPAPQPPPRAMEQKELGNRHFEAARYMEAISCYTRAIDADPAYFEAYYNRGLAWQSLKLFYKGIVDLDRALELRPNDPDVLYFRGLAYEATGQFEEALADIQIASSKGNMRAKKYLKSGELKREAHEKGQKEKTLQSLANNKAENFARTTRTTLSQNAYGGKTTTTVFSKGDPLYDGPEGIFKQVNHYSKGRTIRQSDTFHHALFSAKNDRSKTISHFNKYGAPTLVEHHLTGHNLGKVELIHYGDDGTLSKSETVTLSKYQHMGLDQG